MLTSALLAEDPFPITTAVLEGDLVFESAQVTSIDNLAVNNSGSWLVECDTNFANTDTDGVLLRDGVLFLREGVSPLSGPPGAMVDSFDSVTLNNLGVGGFNFFLTGLPTNEDSGVYVDSDLVIQESNHATADGLSPGTPYIGFFDVKINDADQLLIVASIDDPAIASTVDRALIVVDLVSGMQSD